MEVAKIGLNLLGELLEVGARCAAAAGTARDLGHEAADGERLQDLLRGLNLFCAVAVGLGRERDANGVSNAGEQERRKACGRSDESFRSHSSFSQAEMQRVIAARCEGSIDVEKIADAADLGGENDHVVAEAITLGGSGGFERAGDHGFNHHVASGQVARGACCSRPSCASAGFDRASPS